MECSPLSGRDWVQRLPQKTSGQYSRINASLEARTTYTDSAVEAGITYFYIVTAVDENGAESAYSDTFKVVIPTP